VYAEKVKDASDARQLLRIQVGQRVGDEKSRIAVAVHLDLARDGATTWMLPNNSPLPLMLILPASP
jgi:hypothetical protein